MLPYAEDAGTYREAVAPCLVPLETRNSIALKKRHTEPCSEDSTNGCPLFPPALECRACENAMTAVLLQTLASDYFRQLSRRFPVMCAGDEFHAFPRALAANEFLDRMEQLSPEEIEESIAVLKEFQRQFDAPLYPEEGFEESLDRQLLSAGIAGILLELESSESWRHDPSLYLKIAFVGLDHALTKPCDDSSQVAWRTLARLDKIPSLLRRGAENLRLVPRTHHRAALLMVRDCREYLSELAGIAWFESPSRYSGALQEVRTSLEDFEKALNDLAPCEDDRICAPKLETVLAHRFLWDRSIEEVREIGELEWEDSLNELERLRREINPGQSWQEIYHSYLPPEVRSVEVFTLYEREMGRLFSFFTRHGLGESLSESLPLIRETPRYLRSLRGSGSFAAALGADPREKDFFYLTTRPLARQSAESRESLVARLHREYAFLAAHETVPGHFLLDSVRRKIPNPIRRQMESPLFYEGWATYAERLLGDYGYVQGPMDCLVHARRRLWRAARCRIDVGLATGSLGKGEAVALLVRTGISAEDAARQVRRFQLSPGYQLCYTLGCHEILRLRSAHGNRLGLNRFHREILEGGQLPFGIIDQRLEKIGTFQEEPGRRNSR